MFNPNPSLLSPEMLPPMCKWHKNTKYLLNSLNILFFPPDLTYFINILGEIMKFLMRAFQVTFNLNPSLLSPEMFVTSCM